MWGAMATSTKKKNTDNNNNNGGSGSGHHAQVSKAKTMATIREHIAKLKRRQLDNENLVSHL